VRVLQVARYGSIRGGAETYIATVSEGLRAQGHEVALAYGMEPDPDRPEVASGAQIAGLVEGFEPSEGDETAFDALIQGFAPDVIHVHVPDVPWVAPMAARRAPTLLAVHDHRLNCPTGTKYWTAPKRACTVRPGAWCLGYNVGAHCGSLRANATLQPYRRWRAASRAARDVPVQVFSEFMRGMLATASLDTAKVHVTHYPVPPLEPAGMLDPGDRRPVILATGRLNKEKGFRELIDAMSRVRTPSHLVIAGSGHDRASLERRARGTVGPHRITFTGWIGGSELAAWYEHAAVVCVPSMWPEPFGIVGLEAMARSRPVVAFASGGIGEWLADGQTGRLVTPGDEQGLARALDEVLGDEQLRERMGAAGAERARTAFSLAGHVSALTAIYAEVAAR
jgi:glycosyltransferase involved in cell wall biosynthesis